MIRKRVEQTAELLHIRAQARTTARRGFPAARCSAWRSAARWCASPSIYLMDEPLSSLDAKLRAELRLELKRIQRELGATILYVTHDQIEAMTMASRIGVIRDGQLLQLGTPREIYESPDDRLCRVAARHAADQPPSRRACVPEVPTPPGTETVGIRTEHLQIAARNGGAPDRRACIGSSIWASRITSISNTRAQTLVTLADPHQPLQCRDQDVDSHLSHPLYFDAAGRRIRAVMQ